MCVSPGHIHLMVHKSHLQKHHCKLAPAVDKVNLLLSAVQYLLNTYSNLQPCIFSPSVWHTCSLKEMKCVVLAWGSSPLQYQWYFHFLLCCQVWVSSSCVLVASLEGLLVSVLFSLLHLREGYYSCCMCPWVFSRQICHLLVLAECNDAWNFSMTAVWN